jgi:3-oxoacyl-[acyl-carrier protein] reductase
MEGDTMNMLQGQVALITGGSRGIGKGVAFGLAEQKASVAIADILVEEGRKTVSELRAKGYEAEFFETDVKSSQEVENLIVNTVKKFGRLDILINNAGNATHPAWCYEMSYEDWHSVVDTHLHGSFYCLRSAARVMKEQKYGRIVNISSIASVRGAPTQINYAAAKYGIVGMTVTAAKELGPYGITVNCIQPGGIRTEMAAILLERNETKFVNATPSSRIGEPNDIAKAVNFFVNPASDYITGIVMAVDGGFTLGLPLLEEDLNALADMYPHKR